jgi:hypothetical protein
MSTLSRILSNVKVNRTTGCWEWQLTKERPPIFPYGRIYFGKKYKLVHRVMYEEMHGLPIRDGMCVLHRCDNPSCCRPSHLFLGTKTDNANDRDSKGRGVKGERDGMSKVTASQVLEIRSARAAGRSLKDIAEVYGISFSAVSAIARGKTWKHVA